CRHGRRRTPTRPVPRSRWDAWSHRRAGLRDSWRDSGLVRVRAGHRGRRAERQRGVAVLSYPGFTLLVFERLFERIGRGESRRRFRPWPRWGQAVADPGTGFSRVRSSGRGVRPPPPTPGRWADAGQPGVAWGSSAPGWHTPEFGALAPGIRNTCCAFLRSGV